jgi:hypothetical protein
MKSPPLIPLTLLRPSDMLRQHGEDRMQFKLRRRKFITLVGGVAGRGARPRR